MQHVPPKHQSLSDTLLPIYHTTRRGRVVFKVLGSDLSPENGSLLRSQWVSSHPSKISCAHMLNYVTIGTYTSLSNFTSHSTKATDGVAKYSKITPFDIQPFETLTN
jgi:hypothetical protein